MLGKLDGWKKIVVGLLAAVLSWGNAHGSWSVPEESITSLWVLLGGIALSDFGKSKPPAA